MSLRGIFIGKTGLRTGWRLLIFISIYAALETCVQLVVRHLPALRAIAQSATHDGILSPQFSLLLEGTSIASLFVAMWAMTRIERKSFADYGFPGSVAFGRLFWAGIAAGLAFETLEMSLMYAFGGFSFGGLALTGVSLAGWACVWALAFVLVGINEEGIFRGYLQSNLSQLFGFWPAATVLSAIFGAVHYSNPGEGLVGAIEVFAFAMFACLTLRRTGSLWFAIGFHAATDYAETFLFSVPDSGLKATHVLLNSSLHGPRWLTGGTVGPEGSAIDFVLLGLTALIFAWRCPPQLRTD